MGGVEKVQFQAHALKILLKKNEICFFIVKCYSPLPNRWASRGCPNTSLGGKISKIRENLHEIKRYVSEVGTHIPYSVDRIKEQKHDFQNV